MNSTLGILSGIAFALFTTSCMSTIGKDGSLNASTYVGAPKRVEKIAKTPKGFAFEVIYQNRGVEQRLITTTDHEGKNPKFAKASLEGLPVPFERVERSEFHNRKSTRSAAGSYPYGFVTAATETTGSGGISAGAYILTSPHWLISVQFPRETPDWAARLSKTPGALARDTALLPLMVPIAILTPRIDG
jgi:hypothetical protein